MPGTSRVDRLNLGAFRDNYRDNCSGPKGGCPEMPNLTDTRIKNAKAADRPVHLSDERGLCLEVSPKGGKWWQLKSSFGGRARLLSLGTDHDTG